jgi:hypothetical protein
MPSRTASLTRQPGPLAALALALALWAPGLEASLGEVVDGVLLDGLRPVPRLAHA